MDTPIAMNICLPAEDLKAGQMMKFLHAFWIWGGENFLHFPKDMERAVQWRNYYHFHSNISLYEFSGDYLFIDYSYCKNSSPSSEQNTSFKFQSLRLTL